ncbi:MAG TPA: HD domain-containing protein [Blastocatellia bacterium]
MEPIVLEICAAVSEAGGRAMLVGGSVRDLLLGIQSKDFDIEVYGLSPAELRKVLESTGRVNAVGEQFAVYKVSVVRSGTVQDSRRIGKPAEAPEGSGAQTTLQEARDTSRDSSSGERIEIDVSIPRRESKSGSGHRGFLISGDPTMTFEDASRRRDFTVNAILFDPLTRETIDPWGGAEDLRRRILRAVSAETFVEDSLRVLRAMQLAARFEMTIEPATVTLCRSIDLSDLPRERVWGEIEKLLGAARPSIGLQAALDLLILDKLFPAIKALDGCPQDPKVHPEGDVFVHTRLAVDQAAQFARDLPRAKRLTVMLATLLHDAGKPLTATEVDGKTRHPNHDEAGVEPAASVLDAIGMYTVDGYDVRSQVLALIREHLLPARMYKCKDVVPAGEFRRLARKVDLGLLYLVAKADALGRGPGFSADAEDWFIQRAREIGVEHGPPEPLLLGRHLIEAGIEPGPRMGEILREVYELQLDGAVTTLTEARQAANRIAPAIGPTRDPSAMS